MPKYAEHRSNILVLFSALSLRRFARRIYLVAVRTPTAQFPPGDAEETAPRSTELFAYISQTQALEMAHASNESPYRVAKKGKFRRTRGNYTGRRR